MTPKQMIFATEYLVDLNATRAYKVAYPHVKKDNVAAAAGARLLRNVKVKQYIDKKLEEIESSKIADAKEVMEYLSAVVRREKTENIVVTIREKVDRYVPDENGDLRREIVETEKAEVVEIPAKLSDSNKAAELLGKRYALWTDKVDVTGNIELIFEDDYGDEDN